MNFSPIHWSETSSAANETKCVESEALEYSILIHIFLSVCMLPITLVSNIVILITSVLVPYLHTSNSVIITALAVSDLTVGLLSSPLHIIIHVDETQSFLTSSREACYFTILATTAPEESSLTILCFLSFDRFVSINWPLWYVRHVTDIKKIIAMLFIVLVSVGLNVFDLMHKEHYIETATNMKKQCHRPSYFWGDHIGENVKTILFSVFLVATFFMMIQVTYVVSKKQQGDVRRNTMFSIATSSRNSINPRSLSDQLSRLLHIRLTVYLMFAFVVLWLPTLFTPVADMFLCRGCCQEMYNHWTQFFRLLNSSINAFVYAFVRETYKSAYKYLLTTPPCRWKNVGNVVKTHYFTSFIRVDRGQYPVYHYTSPKSSNTSELYRHNTRSRTDQMDGDSLKSIVSSYESV